MRYSSVGLEVGLSVGVGYFAGSWLDEKLGTEPFLMIVFVLLGTAAGMLSLYRAARRALGEQRSDEPGSRR